MADSITERELVGKFVLWAASLTPGRGALASPEHVDAIQAAAARIARQARAASEAGSVRSKRKGQNGGRPRVDDPSDKRRTQLRAAQRRRRAKSKVENFQP
ncbi:MAG: hypothetical protein QOD00_1688 [Blastocatellia bacterium]|nr:hypothetical protein [Blastocatellia bacterium]